VAKDSLCLNDLYNVVNDGTVMQIEQQRQIGIANRNGIAEAELGIVLKQQGD
jgi:hypothetical protein